MVTDAGVWYSQWCIRQPNVCADPDSLLRWSLVGVVCTLLLFGGAGVLVSTARGARRQQWLALACLIAGIGALALAQRAWATYPSVSRPPFSGTPQSVAGFLSHVNNIVWLFQLAGWTMLAITAILLIAAVMQIRRARRGADVPPPVR